MPIIQPIVCRFWSLNDHKNVLQISSDAIVGYNDRVEPACIARESAVLSPEMPVCPGIQIVYSMRLLIMIFLNMFPYPLTMAPVMQPGCYLIGRTNSSTFVKS